MRFWNRRMGAFVAILVSAASCEAAVFKVGFGSSCTHVRLADAIAAAEANGPDSDEIRIAKQNDDQIAAGPYYIIDQSLRIRGGYDGCAASTPNGTTTLESSGQGSLFTIASAPTRLSSVGFSGLELRGSISTTAPPTNAGGGLAIFGRVIVSVSDSTLRNLRARNGGAMYVDEIGRAPQVSLTRVSIRDNDASDQGGGIYCHGHSIITLYPGTRISRNNARDGGGVALLGCALYQSGAALSENSAVWYGGAVYAADGALVSMGWASNGSAFVPPVVSSNRSERWGGGLFLLGPGTQLDARGAQIWGNRIDSTTTIAEGAALWVGWGATASLQRDRACPKTEDGCATIESNRAIGVAGGRLSSIVAARPGGEIALSGVYIANNRVEAGGTRSGAILDASASAPSESSIVLDNSLLLNNGATSLLGARERTGTDGQVYRGRIDARLTTAYFNSIESIVGGQSTGDRSPVTLAASLIMDNVPLLEGAASADSVFDCLLTVAAPGVATTRSLVATATSIKIGGRGLPLEGSPAIDFCSAEGLPVGETDLRGMPRVLDDPWVWDRYGTIDVGAYEATPRTLIFNPGN